MKLQKLTAVALLVMAGFIRPTFADTPNDASVAKLMQVQHFEQSLRDSITYEMGYALTLIHFYPFTRNEKDDEATRLAKLDRAYNMGIIIENHMKQALLEADLSYFVAQEAKTIKETYTQEEVNALIDFYQTDVGQSIIKKEVLIAFNKAKMKKLRDGYKEFFTQILINDQFPPDNNEYLDKMKEITEKYYNQALQSLSDSERALMEEFLLTEEKIRFIE